VKTLCLVLMFILIPILEETEASLELFYCPDGSSFKSEPEDVSTNFDRNCQCDCCPYNKRWECSIPDGMPREIKDTFVGGGTFQYKMSFACKAHDYCYATYGRSQEDCDDEFHTNMLSVCSTNFVRDFGSLGILSCPAVAGYAYRAVRSQVQDMESKWDKCPEDCKCPRTAKQQQQQRMAKCLEPYGEDAYLAFSLCARKILGYINYNPLQSWILD